MQVIIRPARPEDASEAARLVFSSGPEAFSILFNRRGKTAVDFLEYCLARREGFFGWGVHYIAELDGSVAGAAAFFTRDRAAKMELYTSWYALCEYGITAVPAMMRDGNMVKRLLPPPSKGALYLGDFGVRPELRGKGIGRTILDFGLRMAKERGLAYELDVSVTNPDARRLYESYGFRPIAERESPDPRLPSAVRMQMTSGGD